MNNTQQILFKRDADGPRIIFNELGSSDA